MATVLVTGGAGFIGSHLVDRLLDRGDTVAVIDDLSTGKRENLYDGPDTRERLTFHECDIRDQATVERVVGDTRPDVLAHLAAQMDVRRSVADPRYDAEVNIVGTINLLEACRQAGTGSVVFATSGGCIYGEPAPDDLPVSEAQPAHPDSPYGASKLTGETYLRMYEGLYGLTWASLALGNVTGPRQDPHGEAGVVSIFAGLMLQGQTPVIFGDGSQTRDFVYVADVVDAFVSAIDSPPGQRINIGTGEPTSVADLYRLVGELTGFDRDADHRDPRMGELQHIHLDITRAGEVLGWQPRTSLTDGLRQTVEWIRRQSDASAGVGRAARDS